MLYSCGKKGNTPEPDKKPEVPTIALIAPAKSEVCATGEILSTRQSKVTFKWAAISGASEYSISILNLLNNSTKTESSPTNSIASTLDRNTPYSWQVTSKTATGMAASDTWRFYNAGVATTGYAPFPAVAKNPLQGANLFYTDKVYLSWDATSVDNNIKNYDIYFGTTTNPQLYQKEASYATSGYIAVVKTTYYWKIVTRDTNGNTSESQLFQFTVL